MNTKNNKRFSETDIKIHAVMLKLMQRCPFEKITVSMICKEADINRSTFYAHYLDLFDLLEKMTEQLLALLHEDIVISAYNEVMDEKVLYLLLNHIQEHQYFYSVYLKSKKELPITKTYEKLWQKVIKPAGIKSGLPENEVYYHFLCLKASFNAILCHWVERGCVDDKERITMIISENISQSIRSWLRNAI